MFINLLFPPLYFALLPPIVSAAADARHSHIVFSFAARSTQLACSQNFPVNTAELTCAGAETSDSAGATQEINQVT